METGLAANSASTHQVGRPVFRCTKSSAASDPRSASAVMMRKPEANEVKSPFVAAYNPRSSSAVSGV